MVKRSTGHKLKMLRSDNCGEYLSRDFAEYLVSEGIRHELTVAEMTGSMLAGSGPPQKL